MNKATILNRGVNIMTSTFNARMDALYSISVTSEACGNHTLFILQYAAFKYQRQLHSPNRLKSIAVKFCSSSADNNRNDGFQYGAWDL